MSKLDEDKGIVFSNRVRIGNWFESSKLEERNCHRYKHDKSEKENSDVYGYDKIYRLKNDSVVPLIQYKLNKFLKQMKRGDLLLARYRKMGENLNKPTVLTQSAGSIGFGAKISLYAPHVPASDPPVQGNIGLLLGGRISSNDINYSQELEDGCAIMGFPKPDPTERSTFVITSADYCNREGEQLKYNQEFLLTLSSSLNKKPLYVRYDPNPIPGLCGIYPLYLSKHAVSNSRWRVLPKQTPYITRFEQEEKAINVNTDVVINHCATNINLGMNSSCWVMGFFGKICTPLMKTCLDIYGKETENNIWQVYTPIAN